VPAHVRSHGLVVLPELDELILPFVPEFGKAVDEHDQLTFAGSNVMKTDSVYIGVFVFEHCHLCFLSLCNFKRRLLPSLGADKGKSNDESRGGQIIDIRAKWVLHKRPLSSGASSMVTSFVSDEEIPAVDPRRW